MRRILSVGVAIVLLVLGLPGAVAAQATDAPAGMHRFTVAVGGLSADSRTNWVRLATYSFTTDGQVFESHFHWSQRKRVQRSYTGVVARDCVARECNVQTANGFQATSAPEELSGTYTVDGSTLRISWTGNGWEEWTVSQPIDTLAKLTFAGSSFGATHGYGYGSNAEWSDRASMAEIAAFDHGTLDHNYHLWKTDAGDPYIDEGSGSPFWVTDWDRCTSSRCLGARTPATEYYLATPNTTSNSRRDTLWHWRTALADGRGEYCYEGNSHVKPMLQIIDSDGGFHGWVAVEASLNQTVPDQGANADDIGVFEISEFG
ncbi:hypothetical protein [Actinophytocola gossypii]|uniref:Uncharacterized protein n=1 Tax=Actinophytocola gossypii TaxID=2812003 RepID=A0ABT2JBW8_9PSEU|nr:hypothetical protein [Actinophytocola gossypii]MCT2585360.1 hypothetical protein [Actinophytocola gossypii]